MAMDTDGEGGITFEEFEAFLLSNASMESVKEDERVFQEEMRREEVLRHKRQNDRDAEQESIGRNINQSLKKVMKMLYQENFPAGRCEWYQCD